jgi:hypothetical protein
MVPSTVTHTVNVLFSKDYVLTSLNASNGHEQTKADTAAIKQSSLATRFFICHPCGRHNFLYLK